MAVFCVALLAVALPLKADESGVPLRTDFQLLLDPAARTLTGTMSVVVPCADDDAGWQILLYPNRFSNPDPDLNDVNWPFRYPGGFSPGRMTVSRVEVGGQVLQELDSLAASPSIPLTLPRCEAAKGRASLVKVDFSVQIPQRFGTFGAVDGDVTLTAGWHPVLLPTKVVPGIHLEGAGRYSVDIAVASPGTLVLGTETARAPPGSSIHFEVTYPGPLPLFFRTAAKAVAVRHGDRKAGRILARRGNLPSMEQRNARVAGAVSRALADGRINSPHDSPFLLVEAPLRESMAYPFPGGALYSDMLYSITPLQRFVQQHDNNLVDALLAGILMSGNEVGLLDALVTVNILRLYSWEKGRSRPDFIRSLLKTGEVVQELDKVATDPQIFFQSALFFSPEIAGDLLLSLQGTVAGFPSPLAVARGIANVTPWPWLLQQVRDAILHGQPLLVALIARSGKRNGAIISSLLQPRELDLELVAVRKTGDNWNADICKRTTDANIPVELLERQGSRRTWHVVDGDGQCLVAALGPGAKEPKVLLDPFGLFRQRTRTNSHPRHNDRNYSDLKWMVSRPYISMSTGDRLPTAGFELRMQPRWDLRNAAYFAPELTPSRAVISAGWRYSFGRKVRPSFLANQVGLGVRATQSMSGWGNTFGPSLYFLRYTRQSRTNPFKGHWLTAFVYPVVSSNGQDLGARFGGIGSVLLGRSPDHILAARVFGDGAAGWLPVWETPVSGGYRGVRALGTVEVQTRNRLGGSLEYRLMLDRNWNFSVLDLGYLHGLQAAFFLDAAVHADQPSDLFVARSLYLGAGIGLRTFLQGFGIVPAIFSVDVSYLIPGNHQLPSRVGAVVTFFQPF